MSLTSYRAAPPRGGVGGRGVRMDWKTWRRPTLPCLKTQYHGRWGFSRPSSGWDRGRAPRQDHQVVQSILRVLCLRVVWFWCVPRFPGRMCVSVLSGDDVHARLLAMISMHGVGLYRADRAIRTG